MKTIEKYPNHFEIEKPQSSHVNYKTKIYNKTAALRQVINEIQSGISTPIYPIEIICKGPRGVAYILESNNSHSLGINWQH